MKTNNKFLTSTEASELLGVSGATIKNWVKHNYLFPIVNNQKQFFEKAKVVLLKEKIENGEVERLNSRANKRNSTKKFIPKEYISDINNNKEILSIVNFIVDNSLSIKIAMFYLSIKVLIDAGLILTKNIEKILKFEITNFKNNNVLSILKSNYKNLNSFDYDIKYSELLIFSIPKSQDILGIIYQSIKSEGEKVKQGSYYTPKEIVKNIITEHIKKSATILDPCCGTGQFLLNINQTDIDPENIYGFDIDSTAVSICKINLLLKYNFVNFNHKIFQLNSLTDIDKFLLDNNYNAPKKFDFIFTNPPWGSHFSKSVKHELKEKYPTISSFESSSYFLLEGIRLLKPGGVFSYILPESILNIKTHRDIRKIILENTNILKIERAGKIFTNVFTNVIRLDIKKKANTRFEENQTADNKFTVKQKRFFNNTDFIFDIDLSDKDAGIIEKVFSREHNTLKNQAEWALGIVTGNNKKFLFPNKFTGSEEIYTGKEIKRYSIEKARYFIKLEPEKYQQVAPINKYRADEKLIYKFISNRLVFAYDNRQRLTLNSANILIPKIPNTPIKIILALFNSPLYNFIYQKIFNSIKILKGNLEQLPVPVLTKEKQDQIIKLVNSAISGNNNNMIIDNLIFNLFEISEEERAYIVKNLK